MLRHGRAALFLSILPVLVPAVGAAQELVPNGSFEAFGVCPGSYSRNSSEFTVPLWEAAGTGSPDHFHACSNGEADVPYNWAGVSDAFDGQGYAGIYAWMNDDKEYREYLRCKLTGPLIRDSLYLITFRYKLSSYSKFCIDRIGLLLSDTAASGRHDRPPGIAPTVSFIRDSALTIHTGSWELASARYRARGGERYLTIGNFSTNAGTRHYDIRSRAVQEPMLAGSAYYYIDDVSLLPAFPGAGRSGELLPLPMADTRPSLETHYVLQHITFEFNSHRLAPGVFGELEKVVQFMRDEPQLKVRVEGHTDESGDAGYNLTLSEKRAASVAGYLHARGIAASRITAHGLGETRPLQGADGAQDAANRRVEIEFVR